MTATPLYKTTIIIWTEYDPSDGKLQDLAYEADQGDAYCSSSVTVAVDDPTHDRDWDGTEFFAGLLDDDEAD